MKALLNTQQAIEEKESEIASLKERINVLEKAIKKCDEDEVAFYEAQEIGSKVDPPVPDLHVKLKADLRQTYLQLEAKERVKGVLTSKLELEQREGARLQAKKYYHELISAGKKLNEQWKELKATVTEMEEAYRKMLSWEPDDRHRSVISSIGEIHNHLTKNYDLNLLFENTYKELIVSTWLKNKYSN